MKRDGSTVLTSVNADLLYDASSTGRAGSLLTQMEFVPELIQRLNESPDEVVQTFEKFRSYCMSGCSMPGSYAHASVVKDPSAIRFSVTGDILELTHPRSTWAKYFGDSLKVRRFVQCLILVL